jgi:hypothetical protein
MQITHPIAGKLRERLDDLPILPMEGKFWRCADYAKPNKWDKVIEAAKKMSRIIGIFARIDVYVVLGEVVFGECLMLFR